MYSIFFLFLLLTSFQIHASCFNCSTVDVEKPAGIKSDREQAYRASNEVSTPKGSRLKAISQIRKAQNSQDGEVEFTNLGAASSTSPVVAKSGNYYMQRAENELTNLQDPSSLPTQEEIQEQEANLRGRALSNDQVQEQLELWKFHNRSTAIDLNNQRIKTRVTILYKKAIEAFLSHAETLKSQGNNSSLALIYRKAGKCTKSLFDLSTDRTEKLKYHQDYRAYLTSSLSYYEQLKDNYEIGQISYILTSLTSDQSEKNNYYLKAAHAFIAYALELKSRGSSPILPEQSAQILDALESVITCFRKATTKLPEDLSAQAFAVRMQAEFQTDSVKKVELYSSACFQYLEINAFPESQTLFDIMMDYINQQTLKIQEKLFIIVLNHILPLEKNNSLATALEKYKKKLMLDAIGSYNKRFASEMDDKNKVKILEKMGKLYKILGMKEEMESTYKQVEALRATLHTKIAPTLPLVENTARSPILDTSTTSVSMKHHKLPPITRNSSSIPVSVNEAAPATTTYHRSKSSIVVGASIPALQQVNPSQLNTVPSALREVKPSMRNTAVPPLKNR